MFTPLIIDKRHRPVKDMKTGSLCKIALFLAFSASPCVLVKDIQLSHCCMFLLHDLHQENKYGNSVCHGTFYFVLSYFSAYNTEAFLFQNKPKNLDLTYKTDLDF